MPTSSESVKNTFNFEFYPDSEHERCVRLSFDMEPDLHISEVHRMCRAFAIALGYSVKSVNEYFGEEK